jgi:rhodanese-related sulfurtransferase
MNDYVTVAPQHVAQKISSCLVLDVRTPAEFEEVHIEGAALHPLSELNAQHVKELMQGKSSCVVVCRSGGRARQATEKLLRAGVSDVVLLEGGMNAWEGAGLPVARGKKTISLERQVRIAAGALVFLGSVLGYVVYPGFIALSAFVGAGLMFAGITDTCGMAMMLAKMPWNSRCTPGATESAGKAHSM